MSDIPNLTVSVIQAYKDSSFKIISDKEAYLLGFDTDGQPTEGIDTPEYVAMKHENTPYIEMVEKSTEEVYLINIETGETE